MEHVTIPSHFFLAEARNEYYDLHTRLVQELLQNSLDAGATRIDLTLDEAGYSCRDNGRGMSKERMVQALLTMGGSAKEQGSTGGFGAAKKLLLFAHESFSIRSKSTAVEGAGLSYRFVDAPVVDGTIVSACYASEFRGERVASKAMDLLRKCNFKRRADVYVNGVLFTDYDTCPVVKEIDGLGAVHGFKRKDEGNNCVNVRKNGLFMFYRYIDKLNRKVVLEVEGNSVDVFTQNRDGFRGNASKLFDSFISEVTIDKNSFVKPKARKFLLRGITGFIEQISSMTTLPAEVSEAMSRLLAEDMHDDVVPSVFAQLLLEEVKASGGNAQAVKAATEIVSLVQSEETTTTDFVFDLADSKFAKVPWWFMPVDGKPKFTQLAKLWKVCIREVLKANTINQNFVIGFTLSTTATATHSAANGIHTYLVNPKAGEIDKGSKEEKVISLLTIACHEVVHSQGFQYHDEEFVRAHQTMLVKTLVNAPTWRKLLDLAKNETI